MSVKMVPCKQCGADMNPVEAMMGLVCGRCCRRNQQIATGQIHERKERHGRRMQPLRRTG